MHPGPLNLMATRTSPLSPCTTDTNAYSSSTAYSPPPPACGAARQRCSGSPSLVVAHEADSTTTVCKAGTPGAVTSTAFVNGSDVASALLSVPEPLHEAGDVSPAMPIISASILVERRWSLPWDGTIHIESK